MAKKQDFASKVQKHAKLGNVCPVCGNVFTLLKKVESQYSEESKSWKYSERNVKVCQCNEKEVYA
jgi:hypothetical protein